MAGRGNGAATSSLTLYVGVRWFWSDRPGTLDVDVTLDGAEVTKGQTFPSPRARKKPDSFAIDLPKGRHRLVARSTTQGAWFEIEFDVTRDQHYAQLSYDYYPKDHPYYQQFRPFDPESTSGHREGFRFEIQDEDFGWR